MESSQFSPRIMAVAFVCACIVLVMACSRQAGTEGPETKPQATSDGREAAAERALQEAALAALDTDELRMRGQQALRAQRIYAPAGDNAMEYYIALRKRSAEPDASAESALMDLQPYAVIAAEQAIARADFVEAERLHGLIAAADPLAPSLERIARGIELGRQLESEQEQASAAAVIDEETIATAPTEQARVSPAPEKLVAAIPVSTPSGADDTKPVVLTTPRAAVAEVPTLAAAPASQPPPQQRPSSLDEPIALRSPQPAYPNEERRFGSVVEVTATFTINADGSVGDIQASGNGGVRSAVFERSVKMALRRWQFVPAAQSQTVTRRFTFKP